MRKQPVFVGIVTLLICLGITGCEQFNNTLNVEKNNFVGTWQNTTEYPAVIEFLLDGECTYGGVVGTWELKDNKLSIKLLDSGLIYEYNYWFSNSNRTLLLTRALGYSIIYMKQ